MTVSLDGVVAIVTGAARGMGESHVRGLVAAGARVVATDVLDDLGTALADELGDSVMYRHLDVTDEAGWNDVVAEAEATWGPVGVLINNAGIVMFGSIVDLTVEQFQKTLDINLTGVFLGMHCVAPSMKRAGGGSIVNISSTAGLQGYANLGAYVASKWGVRGPHEDRRAGVGCVRYPGELDPSRPDPDPDGGRTPRRPGVRCADSPDR